MGYFTSVWTCRWYPDLIQKATTLGSTMTGLKKKIKITYNQIRKLIYVIMFNYSIVLTINDSLIVSEILLNVQNLMNLK